MATKEDKQDKKSKLDNEDISQEMGMQPEKADLDSGGIMEQEDKKSALDTEGIVDESGKGAAEHKGDVQKQETKETKQSSSNVFLFGKIKKISPVKLASFLGGIVVLIVGLFCVQYFFLTGSPESAFDTDTLDDIEQGKAIVDIKGYELDPFVVPLKDTHNGMTFIHLTLLLDLKNISRKEIVRYNKKIRATVYNFLIVKSREDFQKVANRERIKKELLIMINRILQKNVVTEVSIGAMHVV